ncbi:MAG: hypothetical protein QG670_2366 [Thermoproteota archaeon]|nr:hypothetical protein [Thermoproteota archaeon]
MSIFCPSCQKTVEGKKNFHRVSFFLVSFFVWFLGLLFLIFLGSIAMLPRTPGAMMITMFWIMWMLIPVFYLADYRLKASRCPICNAKLDNDNRQLASTEAKSMQVTNTTPKIKEHPLAQRKEILQPQGNVKHEKSSALPSARELILSDKRFFCMYCGYETPLDSIYCGQCGKKIR